MIEKNHFYKQQAIILFYMNIFIFFPLHPPFTQATAAKNITSPIAIFDPCIHEKKFFPNSTKEAVPMCGLRA